MVLMAEDRDIRERAYSPDGRYTFCVDERDRIHRIDKQNHRDDLISVEIPATTCIIWTTKKAAGKQYIMMTAVWILNKDNGEWVDSTYGSNERIQRVKCESAIFMGHVINAVFFKIRNREEK